MQHGRHCWRRKETKNKYMGKIKDFFRRVFGSETTPETQEESPIIDPVVEMIEQNTEAPIEEVVAVPVESEAEIAVRLKRESDERHDRERAEKLKAEEARR